MSTVKSNTKEFNKYVKVNWEGLKASGKGCNDPMINLFKGYQNASEHEFVHYIKQKRDNYDDSADMQPETLMMLALNKYETISKMDQWNAKMQEQEQIIALTAELGKIKDKNLCLACLIKSKATGTSKQDKKKGAGKGSNKGKSKNNSKKTHSGEWEWKNHVPSGNDTKHKKFKGKDYYCCPMHKAWMHHHPDECHKKEHLEAQGGEGQMTIPMTIKAKEPHMPMHSMPSSWKLPTARNDCFLGFTQPCSELQLKCQSSLQGSYGLSPLC
jgi:hypothetical protein